MGRAKKRPASRASVGEGAGPEKKKTKVTQGAAADAHLEKADQGTRQTKEEDMEVTQGAAADAHLEKADQGTRQIKEEDMEVTQGAAADAHLEKADQGTRQIKEEDMEVTQGAAADAHLEKADQGTRQIKEEDMEEGQIKEEDMEAVREIRRNKSEDRSAPPTPPVNHKLPPASASSSRMQTSLMAVKEQKKKEEIEKAEKGLSAAKPEPRKNRVSGNYEDISKKSSQFFTGSELGSSAIKKSPKARAYGSIFGQSDSDGNVGHESEEDPSDSDEENSGDEESMDGDGLTAHSRNLLISFHQEVTKHLDSRVADGSKDKNQALCIELEMDVDLFRHVFGGGAHGNGMCDRIVPDVYNKRTPVVVAHMGRDAAFAIFGHSHENVGDNGPIQMETVSKADAIFYPWKEHGVLWLECTIY